MRKCYEGIAAKYDECMAAGASAEHVEELKRYTSSAYDVFLLTCKLKPANIDAHLTAVDTGEAPDKQRAKWRRVAVRRSSRSCVRFPHCLLLHAFCSVHWVYAYPSRMGHLRFH